jgi:hypothetical protein
LPTTRTEVADCRRQLELLSSPANGKHPTKKNGASKEKHCRICNIAGHDGYAHRSQEEKRPFTKEELAALS